MIEHRMSMFAGGALTWRPAATARLVSAFGSERAGARGDVLREQIRGRERGEVPPARQLGPAPDVEERLGETAGRMAGLARERGVRHRHLDPRVGPGPGAGAGTGGRPGG